MKIIEWHSQLPEEARDKIKHYLGTYKDTDGTLDLLNEPCDTLELAVFRCIPDESELNESFKYWYNVIHNPISDHAQH